MEGTIYIKKTGSENEPTVEEIEWMKLEKVHFDEGYADGKFAGRETAKESGEDHGYAKGFKDSFNQLLAVAIGLLGANQCMLRNMESPLLSRAKQIKISLDNFMKYNIQRMKEVECSNKKYQEESNSDSTVELLDDNNSNLPFADIENGRVLKSCQCNCDSHKVHVTHEDFCQLKLEVLEFLNACHQPLILKKITHGMLLESILRASNDFTRLSYSRPFSSSVNSLVSEFCCQDLIDSNKA